MMAVQKQLLSHAVYCVPYRFLAAGDDAAAEVPCQLPSPSLAALSMTSYVSSFVLVAAFSRQSAVFAAAAAVAAAAATTMTWQWWW